MESLRVRHQQHGHATVVLPRKTFSESTRGAVLAFKRDLYENAEINGNEIQVEIEMVYYSAPRDSIPLGLI